MRQHINQHATDYDISLSTLAEHFGVSTKQINRLLKNEVDMTFREYLVPLRVERAMKALVVDDVSISETAKSVGYASISHFVRTFKEYTGLTPSQFKNRNYGGNSPPWLGSTCKGWISLFYESDRMAFSHAELFVFHDLPLPVPFEDATGGPFRFVPLKWWLRLYDSDGIMGQCPCSGLMKSLLPILLTGKERAYLDWYRELFWSIRNRSFSGEAALELGRLDLALHDILAKRQGASLHRFLGATRDWVSVYASGVSTGLSLTEACREAEGFAAEGYQTIKMKAAADFGADPDKDIARIAAVRAVLGKGIKLAVDVNQLWDAERALAFARRMEPYDIAWYEEPVLSQDMVELRKIAQASPIPVAAGESLRNSHLFPIYLSCGVKHLQPIPTSLYSVQEWMNVKNLAGKNRVQLSSGGYSHIAAAFIATAGESAMVEYLQPIMRSFAAVMEYAPEEKNGTFLLYGTPGLPVSLDLSLLKKLGALQSVEYFYSPNTMR